MTITIAGENALIVYFGDKTDPAINAQVQHAGSQLRTLLGDKLVDLVPSYASLLVVYDIEHTDHFEVKAAIRQVLQDLGEVDASEGRVVELPVYYSEESGPDLKVIAERAGLSTQEVIDLHVAGEYRVYAIGFAPGFAYLGEVDERIAAPRLSTPRLKVPRGAVAIADRQTAVYPAQSPGGWNIVGLCPTRMFDPEAEPTMPVQSGDIVKFRPISKEEFLELGGELATIE